MVDVFISYPQREHALMLPIKQRLEALGLVLFVDVDGRLDGESTFPEALDKGVRASKAVLGCWSPWALRRPWVQTECAIGKDENKLVAVERATLTIADVPALFYLVDRKPLVDFDGVAPHEGWAMTLTALATKLKLWVDKHPDHTEVPAVREKVAILEKAAGAEREAKRHHGPARPVATSGSGSYPSNVTPSPVKAVYRYFKPELVPQVRTWTSTFRNANSGNLNISSHQDLRSRKPHLVIEVDGTLVRTVRPTPSDSPPWGQRFILVLSDGATACVDDAFGRPILFDLRSGHKIGQLPFDGCLSAALLISTQVAYFGTSGGEIKVFDLKHKSEKPALREHAANINALTISNDGGLLISGDVAGMAMQWSLARSETVARTRWPNRCIEEIEILETGIQLIGGGRRIKWDDAEAGAESKLSLADRERRANPRTYRSSYERVDEIQFTLTANDRSLLVIVQPCEIRMFGSNGRLLWTYERPALRFHEAMAFSNSSQEFVIASHQDILVFEAQSGNLSLQFKADEHSSIEGVAFGPDDDVLYSLNSKVANAPGTIKAWDPKSGSRRHGVRPKGGLFTAPRPDTGEVHVDGPMVSIDSNSGSEPVRLTLLPDNHWLVVDPVRTVYYGSAGVEEYLRFVRGLDHSQMNDELVRQHRSPTPLRLFR